LRGALTLEDSTHEGSLVELQEREAAEIAATNSRVRARDVAEIVDRG